LASLDEKIKAYGQTPGGKAVMIAVPVAILAAVLLFAVLTLLQSGEEPIEVTTPGEGAPPAAESPAPTETPKASRGETQPAINQDYEVYETRDPFKPAESTASASPEARRTNSSPVAPAPGSQPQTQVLSLQSTEDQDGVWYANVKLGSATHTVRAGDRVGDSSFQVVAVSSDSATFLYGDDRLTLTVGQEVNK
jgi:hypothetical protein